MPVRTSVPRIARLLEALKPGPVLILMHDNPDPDCLASAAGLKLLLEKTGGLKSVIAYGGLIGRASNKAIIKALDLSLRHVDSVDFDRFPRIATVDTQPRGGNNALPHDRNADVVIDHHALRKATRSVPFVDIRTQYGATCTMIAEYLNENEIVVPPWLATLMFYAIRTETQELGREASKADVEAYMEFFPSADLELISSIERARIPLDYFVTWQRAMSRAKLHGDVVGVGLGAIENPDMVPEIADLLLRLEGVAWTIVAGYHRGNVLFSIRTNVEGVNAGAISQRVVGKKGTAGGHDTMAGGRVPVTGPESDPAVIQEELVTRLVKVLGVKGITRPLMPELTAVSRQPSADGNGKKSK